MHKYSKTTDLIYPTSYLLSYKNLPDDLVFITPEEAGIHMGNGIPDGKVRVKHTYPFEFEDIPTIEPCIETCKSEKVAELNAACENEIYNTLFESSALGSVYSYDCRAIDQTNLAGKIAGGIGAEVWAHTQPKFEEVFHTHDQLVLLQRDMTTHIRSSTVAFRLLCNQVAAVSESSIDWQAEIEAIKW